MTRLLSAASLFLALAGLPAWVADQNLSRSSSAIQPLALQVELTTTIRASKAKVGDPVKARTVTALILSQTAVPEGSKLVGHVSHVEFTPNGAQETVLAIAFDELQLKHGKTLPAKFSIRAAGSPRVTFDPTDDSADTSNTPSPSSVPPTTGHKDVSLTPSGRNPNSPPPSSPQAEAEYDRRDLRAAREGTLIGMPGVSLRIDREAGAATFLSENPKLELKSGLQLALRVDPRPDSPPNR